MNRKYFLIILMSFFIMISLIGFATLQTINRLHELNESVNNTFVDISKIDTVLTKLTDAETGQRGFIITGNEDYLRPYEDAVVALDSPEVEFYFKSSPPSPEETYFKNQYSTLKELEQDKLKELKSTIELRRSKGFDAAKKVVESNKGKEYMDEIRRIIYDIQSYKKNKLKKHEENLEENVKKLFYIVTAGNAIAFALICGSLYFLYRDYRKRVQAEAVLAEINIFQNAILNSANQAIISLDSKGSILSSNKGAENLFGFSLMRQPSILNIYNESQNAEKLYQLSKKYGKIFKNPLDYMIFLGDQKIIHDEEWQAIKKDGTIFTFLQTFTPLRDSFGKLRGFLLIGNDITERKKWTTELGGKSSG